MTPQRILGALVLGAGITLLIVGLNASHSIADQVSNTFTGRFTQATAWYLIGGAATAILGLSMILFGRRGNNA